MGNCVSPSTDDQTTFSVWNVDDAGNKVQPGKISITDTHLVFLQKGGDPIRWPLSGLRRYGFDAELFSFESGRRCPTGSGVYAFKCPRAERLFNILQERIQAAAPIPVRPSSLVDSPPSPTVDYLEPISIGASVVSSVHYVNNIQPASNIGPGGVTPSAQSAIGIPPVTPGGPVYQNVPVQQNHTIESVVSPSLSINTDLANCMTISLGSGTLETPGVNYAVLDLDHSEPPTPTSPVSTHAPSVTNHCALLQSTSNMSDKDSDLDNCSAPLGYAQIDFDKTQALQACVNRQRMAL